MKQFKNILLVTPVDAQLISHAVSQLRSSHSRLTLISAVPPLDRPKVTLADGKTIDMQKLLEQDLKKELDEQAEKLREHEFRVRTVVACGQPLVEIVRQVAAKKHDLVVMRSDGVSNLREQLFGTLSLHLMRKCPCPVWVVKPSRRRKLRNVFAAVDPDPKNPVRDRLNKEILMRATTMAQNENAKLHVVHAWTTLGGDINRSRRWMSRTEIRLHVEQVGVERREQLNNLLDAQTDGSAIVHMVHGSSGIVIPEVVNKYHCDLLVMGTVCRTGIPGLFIGNTAETILGQVDCSVLAIKPSEFVTPVKLD